jgi:glycosyltransferase involved in cell wall biosynthesis
VTVVSPTNIEPLSRDSDLNRDTPASSDASHPLVTVTFVAWMRRELLIKGIESVLVLAYQPVEILVVDNSPTDEIFQWLQEAYPTVKCVKTFAPLPLPMVRNLMVASARGKYVVFHDDDSRFAETAGLTGAVEYLETNPQVACLAFRQLDERGRANPQFDGSEICPAYTFIACAVMFRRADYLQAGGYYEKYYLYGEELPLSLGFYGLGKEIHYYPHVPVIHEQVMHGRKKDPGAVYHVAQIVMHPGAFLLRVPLPDVLAWYPLLLGADALKVVAKRRPFVAIRGALAALWWFPRFLSERRPISRHDFARWMNTRREYQQGTLRRIREARSGGSAQVSAESSATPVAVASRELGSTNSIR